MTKSARHTPYLPCGKIYGSTCAHDKRHRFGCGYPQARGKSPIYLYSQGITLSITKILEGGIIGIVFVVSMILSQLYRVKEG